jgi:hypothetical protein
MSREATETDVLTVRPTVDRLSGMIVPVLLGAFVLWLALDAKLVQVHAERDAAGRGRCAVVELWRLGDRLTLLERAHDAPLGQVHVGFHTYRSNVTSRLSGPGFDVKLGGDSEGRRCEEFLAATGPATYDATRDMRFFLDYLAVAMLVVGLFAVPSFVSSTVVADRRAGTLRVTYRFLGLQTTREARLSEVKEAWADTHIKREDQLFVHLRDGRKMRLSFPFTPVSDRARIARSINAFLAT